MQRLIEELDNLVRRGRRLPGGRLVVDEAAVQQVLEQMRVSLPEELKLGQRITEERERILADARAQAQRILEEAESRALSEYDQSDILVAARDRAREVQREAEVRAARLRADADSYVMGQLEALEVRLERALREVRGGRQALAEEAGPTVETAPTMQGAEAETGGREGSR